MILSLLDLTIATTCLACKGIYNGTKYLYDWYYEIEPNKEPTIRDLQIELKNMGDLLEKINKEKEKDIVE